MDDEWMDGWYGKKGNKRTDTKSKKSINFSLFSVIHPLRSVMYTSFWNNTPLASPCNTFATNISVLLFEFVGDSKYIGKRMRGGEYNGMYILQVYHSRIVIGRVIILPATKSNPSGEKMDGQTNRRKTKEPMAISLLFGKHLSTILFKLWRKCLICL